MRKRASGAVVGAILLLGGISLGAQVPPPPSPQERGWIGIAYTFVTLPSKRGEEATAALVTAVVDGSPAEEAGIAPGDTLLAIDGRPANAEAFRILTTTVAPGDFVRMTLRRGSRTRDVLVEAGTYPPSMEAVVPPLPPRVIMQLDSVRGAILQSLDSIRLQLVQVDSMGELVRQSTTLLLPDSTGLISIPEIARIEVQKSPRGSEIRLYAPEVLDFEGWRYGTLQDPQVDSLRIRIREIRRELNELRHRQRVLRSALRSLERARARKEVEKEVAGLQREEERLEGNLLELTQAIQALQQKAAERAWAESVRAQERMLQLQLQEQLRSLGESREARWQAMEEAARLAREARVFSGRLRPLAPYILGESVVGGAKLTPLNPALAEYFQVEEGLLVTEVAEGTPAAEAGLRAGDVIVRVGGDAVSTLEDLRWALASYERPVEITVVRKGKRLKIEFPDD